MSAAPVIPPMPGTPVDPASNIPDAQITTGDVKKATAQNLSRDVQYIHPFMAKVCVVAGFASLAVTGGISLGEGASFIGALLRGIVAAVICVFFLRTVMFAAYGSIADAVNKQIEQSLKEELERKRKAVEEARERARKASKEIAERAKKMQMEAAKKAQEVQAEKEAKIQALIEEAKNKK